MNPNHSLQASLPAAKPFRVGNPILEVRRQSPSSGSYPGLVNRARSRSKVENRAVGRRTIAFIGSSQAARRGRGNLRPDAVPLVVRKGEIPLPHTPRLVPAGERPSCCRRAEPQKNFGAIPRSGHRAFPSVERRGFVDGLCEDALHPFLGEVFREDEEGRDRPVSFRLHVPVWLLCLMVRRHHRFSGTFLRSSRSHTSAFPSDGALQSPRGESAPAEVTLGPFGNAERLNWLIV